MNYGGSKKEEKIYHNHLSFFLLFKRCRMFIVKRNEGKNREDVMKGEEGMERSRYAKEGHRDGWKKGKEENSEKERWKKGKRK